MSHELKWIEVEFQGQVLRVPALKSQGKLWLHWQGETSVIELNVGSRRGGGERGKTHPGVVTAPMPGKVTRVAVKKNERVKRGAVLAVMEAMKMEYTLEADRAGVVIEVNVQEGMQVGLGTVLVRIAKEEGTGQKT